MIREALEWLAEQARPESIVANGETLVRPDYVDPRKPEPKAEPLVFRTLYGLVGYLDAGQIFESEAGPFPAGPGSLIVHVESPTHVRVVGPARERWHDREVVAEARIERWWASADRWSGALDRSIVELRSCFTGTGDRDALVAALGNVRGGTEVRVNDDGFSQEVVVNAELKADWKTLPNPATLAPFRTFPEVEQPASPFLVRLEGGGEDAIRVSLHQADGGAWELVAVAGVGEYLREALGDDWIVLV